MNSRVFTLWLACIFLLQGCSRNAELAEKKLDQTPNPTLVAVSTSVEIPSVAITPTTSPTGTATQMIEPLYATTTTPARSLESVDPVQQTCLTILPQLPEDKIIPGKIALVSKLIYEGPQNYYENFSFYDLKTRKVTLAYPNKILTIGVTPDRTKYGVVDATDLRVKVFSTDGQPLKVLPTGEVNYSIDAWLDNERIALVVVQPGDSPVSYKYPRDEIVINPFSNEQKDLPSDFPEIDKAQARILWEGISTTKYDPRLTRVIYPAHIDKDYLGKQGDGYILWDMEKQVNLFAIVTADFHATPKWAPDGSKFIINDSLGNGEFYIVSREGKVLGISHLNPNGRSSGKRYFSDRYAWSPNGRYIAFWRETFINEVIEGTFAILDTEIGGITDYCISTGYIERGYPRLPSFYTPVWSPDGVSLVIVANMKEDGAFETILIDLAGKTAAKIGDNVTPVGWLR